MRKNKERVINEAIFYITNESTMRETASHFKVSKSTIYRDLATLLPDIDKSLFTRVHFFISKNKAERHLRGGMATKRLYGGLKYERA